MRPQLTADDIFSLLLLLRSADARLVILVEGPADCAVLDPHLEVSAVQTVPAHSKSAVLGTMVRVEQRGLPGVAGLVDADLDGISSEPEYPSGVVATALYDVDAHAFFAAGVAQRVITAFADPGLVSADWGPTNDKGPVEAIVGIAAAVGAVRYIASQDGLGLNVRSLPMGEFVDASSLGCNVERMAEIVFRRSDSPGITPEELAQKVGDVLALPPCALERLCSGHDLASIAAHLVRTRWNGSLGADQAERALRAAVSCHAFATFDFVVALTAWAAGLGSGLWHDPCVRVLASR